MKRDDARTAAFATEYEWKDETEHLARVSFTIDRYVKVYRDDVRDAVQRNDRPAVAQ